MSGEDKIEEPVDVPSAENPFTDAMDEIEAARHEGEEFYDRFDKLDGVAIEIVEVLKGFIGTEELRTLVGKLNFEIDWTAQAERIEEKLMEICKNWADYTPKDKKPEDVSEAKQKRSERLRKSTLAEILENSNFDLKAEIHGYIAGLDINLIGDVQPETMYTHVLPGIKDLINQFNAKHATTFSFKELFRVEDYDIRRTICDILVPSERMNGTKYTGVERKKMAAGFAKMFKSSTYKKREITGVTAVADDITYALNEMFANWERHYSPAAYQQMLKELRGLYRKFRLKKPLFEKEAGMQGGYDIASFLKIRDESSVGTKVNIKRGGLVERLLQSAEFEAFMGKAKARKGKKHPSARAVSVKPKVQKIGIEPVDLFRRLARYERSVGLKKFASKLFTSKEEMERTVNGSDKTPDDRKDLLGMILKLNKDAVRKLVKTQTQASFGETWTAEKEDKYVRTVLTGLLNRYIGIKAKHKFDGTKDDAEHRKQRYVIRDALLGKRKQIKVKDKFLKTPDEAKADEDFVPAEGDEEEEEEEDIVDERARPPPVKIEPMIVYEIPRADFEQIRGQQNKYKTLFETWVKGFLEANGPQTVEDIVRQTNIGSIATQLKTVKRSRKTTTISVLVAVKFLNELRKAKLVERVGKKYKLANALEEDDDTPEDIKQRVKDLTDEKIYDTYSRDIRISGAFGSVLDLEKIMVGWTAEQKKDVLVHRVSRRTKILCRRCSKTYIKALHCNQKAETRLSRCAG